MGKFEQTFSVRSADCRDFTILVIEGCANDVAAYAMYGRDISADDVLKNGHKMTEKEAREVVGWPSRLSYRR